MDIKDCKVRTRVVCINPDYDNVIPVGAVGTVIENGSTIPWVSFDDVYSAEQQEVCGYKNCKVMGLDEIEVLEENTSEEGSAKETNIGNLTVSISLEDKQEIAKDVLKIVLKDFNKVITDAIAQLDDDDSEYGAVEIKQTENVLSQFTYQKMTEIVEQALKEVFKETFQNTLNK